MYEEDTSGYWVQTLNSYTNSIEHLMTFDTLEEATDYAKDYAKKFPCEDVYVVEPLSVYVHKN